MSNSKIQAANDLHKFAGMFRGLLDLAEELEDIGSLQEAGDREATRLLELTNQVKEKEQLFAKLLQEKQAAVAAMQEYGGNLEKAAKADAEAIRHRAAEDAGTMLAKAHSEAKEIVAEAKAVHDGHMANAVEWRAKADAARVDLAGHQREIDAAKREVARITQLITDLKAKF